MLFRIFSNYSVSCSIVAMDVVCRKKIFWKFFAKSIGTHPGSSETWNFTKPKCITGVVFFCELGDVVHKSYFHATDSLKLTHLSPDGAEVKESNNTFWLEVRISKMNFLHIPYFCIGCSLKVFSFYITQDHFRVTDMGTALLINISFVFRDFPTSVSQLSQIIHLFLKFKILE